jgi:hypothetical protein
MRKRIGPANANSVSIDEGQWLDVTQVAVVEVTSEDSAYPIESALTPGESPGWRATQEGRQTIRLLFDQPQTVRRILLEFEERDQERVQELVLRWHQRHATEYCEIIRQQYNFSPEGSTREVEDYRVELSEAVALELSIVPNLGGGPTRASLRKMLLQ